MPLTIEEYNAIASKLNTTIATSQKGITDNQEVIHAIVTCKEYGTGSPTAKQLDVLGSTKYADTVELFETIEEQQRTITKPFLEILKPAPTPALEVKKPTPIRITRYRKMPRE